MNREELLWDRIFQLKFTIIIFVVMELILFALFLILFFSKELAGSICTGIFFCILLGLIIFFRKKKKKLEAALQEYRENIRKF